MVKGRNVNGSVFYDFGQSYLSGQFSPLVNGVGVGLGWTWPSSRSWSGRTSGSTSPSPWA